MTVISKLFTGILKKFQFQYIFFKLKFSLTRDPMGVKISKRYSSYSCGYFSSKVFVNVFLDSPHKNCLYKFWKFKFNFKNRLKFNIVANEKISKLVNVPCDKLHKSSLLGFWHFKFKVFKKGLKFSLRFDFYSSYSYNSFLTKLWVQI